jgi:hypothetical protein
MTYAELTAKLIAIEKVTGLYLHDPCVDAENAGANPSDWMLMDCALCMAEQRAHEKGFDLHDLLKSIK